LIKCATKLSIDPVIAELGSYIFRRENKIFVKFFSNSKFKTRVYWSFFEAKPKFFFFFTFLRISLRKINILKRAKLHWTELSKIYGKNKKYWLLYLTGILKSATKNGKNWKKNKSVQKNFILKYAIKRCKIITFYLKCQKGQ
jgi:hypothetical protein